MSQAHRIDHLNDGQVVYIALDPDGVWARSEFPHPLITVDYDENEEIIAISAAGPAIHPTLDSYNSWLKAGSHDPHQLVDELGGTRELVA